LLLLFCTEVAFSFVHTFAKVFARTEREKEHDGVSLGLFARGCCSEGTRRRALVREKERKREREKERKRSRVHLFIARIFSNDYLVVVLVARRDFARKREEEEEEEDEETIIITTTQSDRRGRWEERRRRRSPHRSRPRPKNCRLRKRCCFGGEREREREIVCRDPTF
jgi:hypothetical protein|tara:strand:+ start:382 stop:885 length:504 start_codon:yes stop_codon:yes gene_type:complete